MIVLVGNNEQVMIVSSTGSIDFLNFATILLMLGLETVVK